MYTFGILAAFFLILSGIIFKKRIKQNQLAVGLIVFAGTLIGMAVVNGVVGMKTPWTLVDVKEKNLKSGYISEVMEYGDTLYYNYSYIDYHFKVQIDEDGDTTYSRYIDLGNPDAFYMSNTTREGENIGRTIEIKFLPEGDTIPYYEVKKYKRIPDNRWVSGFGLPPGGRHFIAYIPNDSLHNVLMSHMNEKFFEYEEAEKIAQLD